jgi:hypothetical protein
MRPVALGRKNWLHVGSARRRARRYSFSGGMLPPARPTAEGLLHRRAARIEPENTLRGRQSHPGSLVDRPRVITLGSSDAYGYYSVPAALKATAIPTEDPFGSVLDNRL